MLAYAQSGFDCVISNGQQCSACSDCYFDEFEQLHCGSVEKSASCSGNERADCTVSTDENGNSVYTATCEAKSYTPIGGPGGIH